MPVNSRFIKMMSVTHLFWYQLTGGLVGGSFLGRPILLLTTTGRKSGKRYTTPLQYLLDGENMVLAASNGGNRHHPDWWLNLLAHPEAEVQIRREGKQVTAEPAKGRERDRLWGRLVEMYSGYQDYQMTTRREIPVVILRTKQEPDASWQPAPATATTTAVPPAAADGGHGQEGGEAMPAGKKSPATKDAKKPVKKPAKKASRKSK
jgi:deazaflavin-dependent oxidoreductase (nitroreductase family)